MPKMEISAKTTKDIQLLAVSAKNSIPEFQPGNVSYKMEIRKFPIYKLKQKRSKEVKN